MFNLIKKTGLIITAVVLIAATGGYSVYQHYCNCSEMTTVSFISETGCGLIEADQQIHDCCAKKVMERSCCDVEETCQQEKGHHTGNCCKSKSHFYKIDDSYTASQLKSPSQPFYLEFELVENHSFFSEEPSYNSFTPYSGSSPPLGGRKMLLRMHQLKLAPELA